MCCTEHLPSTLGCRKLSAFNFPFGVCRFVCTLYWPQRLKAEKTKSNPACGNPLVPTLSTASTPSAARPQRKILKTNNHRFLLSIKISKHSDSLLRINVGGLDSFEPRFPARSCGHACPRSSPAQKRMGHGSCAFENFWHKTYISGLSVRWRYGLKVDMNIN